MKKTVLSLVLWDRKSSRLLLLVSSLLATFFGLLAPYFQKEFADRLTGSTSIYELAIMENRSLYFFIAAAFFCLLLSQALSQLTSYIGAREALYSQRKLAERVYQKTLELKVDTISQRSLGEIVSIYATDVPGSTIFLEQTFPQGTSTFFPLILAPLALSFLLHTSLFSTVIVMIAVSVINTSLAFRQSKFFFLFKQLAAERIALVNEWITQMRGLRILGWIESFEQKIYKKRVVETKNRIGMVTNGQVMNSISSSLPFTLNTMALASMTIGQQTRPTSGEILASLWILGIFLARPFRQMPWFFTFAFDGWTSIKRLQNFLDLENKTSPNALVNSTAQVDAMKSFETPLAINIEGLQLQIGADPAILNNINFKMKPGEFVAIVGEVGCGKSLFLLSLLRETGASFQKYEVEGKNTLEWSEMKLKSFYSYVPQESFIMSATLEQNVIFDYTQRLEDPGPTLQALDDSQLKTETSRWTHGLQSELGERGVNLSGGQKQRISLARVAYSDRQIVLVDDGFSNLDFKTEQALLDTLFFGRWKNKSRLLATHRLSVLPLTDRILFMKNGQFINEGRFEDLLKTDPEFKKFTASLSKQEGSANAPQG